MSATVYQEPYKLPAGILALVVHSVFFALLYFGFNWNRQALSNPTMNVELWPSLPEEVAAAPVNPRVEEIVQPPPQEKIVKPDIMMPEKKKVAIKPVETRPEKKKPVPKSVAEVKPKPDTPKPAEQNPNARIADQQAAANGRVVDEYKAKIQAKIRSKIVMPPDVADDARAEFLVTLLPDGDVMKPNLKKSSGNAAYDDAVERAILKSVPLPLPPDVQLFNRFRELDLVFKPTE